MRDIKFRAVISENTTIFFALKDLLDNKFSNRELLWPWLKDNQPDEFTGLKDSKRTEEFPDGQEIYEGDILRTCHDHHIIKWDAEDACWDLSRCCGENTIMEVIGTIHENKKSPTG